MPGLDGVDLVVEAHVPAVDVGEDVRGQQRVIQRGVEHLLPGGRPPPIWIFDSSSFQAFTPAACTPSKSQPGWSVCTFSLASAADTQEIPALAWTTWLPVASNVRYTPSRQAVGGAAARLEGRATVRDPGRSRCRWRRWRARPPAWPVARRIDELPRPATPKSRPSTDSALRAGLMMKRTSGRSPSGPHPRRLRAPRGPQRRPRPRQWAGRGHRGPAALRRRHRTRSSSRRLSLEPSVSSVTWNVVETTVPLGAAEEE